MKLLLVLALVGAALAVPLQDDYSNIQRYYHENIGIKEAEYIKAAEEADAASPVGSRIVGGNAASLGQYPYVGGLIITLTDGRQSVCGSSMLSNTRAVTAAHCWFDGRNQARQFTVVYGSLTIFSGGTRVTTSSVVAHNNWNPNNLQNDVAVIGHSSVSYNNNIRNIPLASGNGLFAGVTAFAAGYGRQSDSQSGIPTSQRLHHVQLTTITNAVCRQTFNVPASVICTSGANGRSVCNGDSGGPLAVNGQLVGIVSFGHASGCSRGFPQAFARVTSFRSFIQQYL